MSTFVIAPPPLPGASWPYMRGATAAAVAHLLVAGCGSPSAQLLYSTIGHSVAVVPPPPAPPPSGSDLQVPADASPEARDAALAAALDRVVASSGATGAALAVVRDGELAFSYATGVERAGGARITDETLFRIGSVGKFFTALSAVLAAEQGELSLDAPIADVLPGVDPAITMRLLLSHQAGVPDSATCEKGLDTPSAWASVHAGDPLWSPPGALFNYSNAGMTLAAAALERTTGRAFTDLVRERLFGPAEMHTATYALDPASPAHAHGHASDGSPVADEPVCGLNIAAGAAWTSARELAALARSLIRVDAPLLTNADLAEVLREERSTTGADIDYAGLGIFLRHYRGRTIANHGGTMNGFSAQFVFVPEERFALAILVNGAGAAGFPGAAIDLYLPPRAAVGAPPVDRDSFPHYRGMYSDPHGELGTFRIESAGEGVFRMVPLSGRRVQQFNETFTGTFWADSTGVFRWFATRWGVALRVGEE
jgi:CubicO group peptidase (beta-lactamase class C family)